MQVWQECKMIVKNKKDPKGFLRKFYARYVVKTFRV